MSISIIKRELTTVLMLDPVITSPSNNSMGTSTVPTTFTASPLKNTFNFSGTHTSTDWELSSSSDFNTIELSSYNDSVNLTTWTPFATPPQFTMYVRCAFNAGVHKTNYSVPVKLFTIFPSIDTPNISVTGYPSDVSLAPTITGSAFVSNFQTTHMSTHWIIYDVVSNVEIWSSFGNYIDLTSIQVPAGLLSAGNTYKFAAMYNTPTISSLFSSVTASTPTNFVTQTPNILTPNVFIPGSPAAISTNPLLYSSSYQAIGSSEPHLSTDWVVKDSNNVVVWSSMNDVMHLTNIQVPINTLAVNTTYAFVATFNSATLSSLPGSNTQTISSNIRSIGDPTLTVQGSPFLVPENPILTSSTYSPINTIETHTSTDWVIVNAVGTPVWSSNGDIYNLTTVMVPRNYLKAGTVYTAKVTYHSATLSSTTTNAIFTTMLVFPVPTINPPTLTVQGSPSSVPESAVLTSGAYSTANTAETHVSTDWVVKNAAGVIVWSLLASTTNLTSVNMPKGVLTAGNVYTFSVVYNSATLSSTATTLNATTMLVFPVPTINPPTLTVQGSPSSVPESAVLTSGAYSTANTSETHVSTDWVVKNAAGAVVWSSIGDVYNLTTVTIQPGFLLTATSYTFSVIYNSATLSSAAVTVNATTMLTYPVVSIVTPTLTVMGSPINVPETPTLTSSTYSTTNSIETHISTDWIVKNAAGSVVWQSLLNLVDLTTVTLPPNALSAGTTYTFSVVYHSINLTSLPSIVSATTMTVFPVPTINPPTLTVQGSPSSVPENPTLTSGAYSTANTAETHVSTDWVVKNAAGAIVWNLLASTTNLTSVNMPKGVLTAGNVYTFSVVYNSATLSSTVTTLNATTIAVFPVPTINPPTLTVQGSPSSVPENPTLTSGAYSTANTAETHVSTDWVVKNAAGVIVWSLLASTTNLTSVNMPKGVLTAGNVYTFSVVYNSATLSSTATTLNATTIAVFPVPTINPPTLTVQGSPSSVPENPTLTSGAYSTANTAETHVSTDWVVKNAAGVIVWSLLASTTNLTSVNMPLGVLIGATSYTFSVVYNSATLSSTATTLNATTVILSQTINTPTLSVQGSPANVPENPVLTSTAYSTVNTTETHVSTDWIITNSVGGAVWSSLLDVNNLTTITVPVGILLVGTVYTFSVKYNSATLSSLQNIQNATTMNAFAVTGVGNLWQTKTGVGFSISHHGQSMLNTGEVIITGGFDSGAVLKFSVINKVQKYTPSTNTWTLLAPMPYVLYKHAQCTLANGDVLVTGGDRPTNIWTGGTVTGLAPNYSKKSLQYTPATNTWRYRGKLPSPLIGAAISPLANGKALMTGGFTAAGVESSATALFSGGWTPASALPFGITDHTQNILASGVIILIGGSIAGTPQNTMVTYDPVTKLWTTSASVLPQPLSNHAQSVMNDGNIIVTGGINITEQTTTYIYNTTTNSWITKAASPIPFSNHRQSILADGSLLVTNNSAASYLYI